MNAPVTDDEVLLGLKKMLVPEYSEAIANATTLEEAETKLVEVGMTRTDANIRIRNIREQLQAWATPGTGPGWFRGPRDKAERVPD